LADYSESMNIVLNGPDFRDDEALGKRFSSG
jgi:hypothetical protein